jgi:transposase InsO family protein
VAAVLVQFVLNDKGERIPMAISHQSRRFAPREAKWEISVREMYAIKYGLFKFRDYLQGCPNVTVHSDHLNLVNGLWKHSSPKIQRWRMFLESMRPFFLQHISGTDRMQLVADSLSRLHVENLRSRATAEELDPATIAMMQRGEGEDDAPMFNEAFTANVGTQTGLLHALTDIQVHNSSCAVFQSLTTAERAQQQAYGIGFDLISSQLNAAPPTSPLRASLPQSNQPLRPSPTRGRPGIGFKTNHCSHHTAPCVANTSVHHSPDIESAQFIEEWVEEEEERKCSSQSQGSSDIWCNAMLSAPSQTLPQDYQNLAYVQSGGFPLEEVLKRAHDDTHPGFLCTYRRVVKALGPRSGVSGAEIKDQVRRFCDSCLTCQKILPARTKLQIKTGTIRSRPFASYAFDVVTLSSPDADGNRYILVCVDSFSRAVELFALKQANAHEVFQALNDVLCRWGTPHELRCDNAKAFTSSIVRALLSRAHVKQHLTAPYSHQSNGQVENCNRRVMDILRALVMDDRLGVNTSIKWSLLLPQVRRVIMTRTVTQHGCTPNELAYMHCPETEASIFSDEPWMPAVPLDASEPAWISKLAQQHRILIDICEEKQDALVQKLAAVVLGDPSQSERKLQVGDCALLKVQERSHSKIQAPWAGPYLVISFPRNDADAQMVELQHLSSKKVGLFHLNMLKFCDLTQLSTIEQAIPYAAKDSFEYEIAEVLAHRPIGPRRQQGQLRAKNTYEFQCLWKDLDVNEDNPSWEPWTNESMRSCEAYLIYTQRPDVEAELGKNF